MPLPLDTHAAATAQLGSADHGTPRDSVISVRSVSKRYLIYDRPQHRLWQGLFRGRRQFFRDFWAVRDVSIDVQPGETVGIIGPNGSGKSTLLQMVCGTLEPTMGTVAVRGRVAALLELGSGFNPEFTGRENVYMYGAILGLGRREVDHRFADIAAFADIGPFIDQPIKTYSSGMIVRLAFSVVAHVDADVLVIDEALAVGDALFTQKCMRFLRRFQERGTILFVSHDTGAVLSLCQRALWMHEGVCVEAGSAKAVVEAYQRANLERAQRLEQAASGSIETPVVGAPAPRAVPPMRTDTEPTNQPEVAQVPAAPRLFDPNAPSFGARGAEVDSVELIGAGGVPTVSLTGGQPIVLRVRFTATSDIGSAIVGFHWKDRLGQVLFGENTCELTASAPVALRAGEAARAEFSFVLPLLRTGHYTLDVAVAEGTYFQHVQHHWFHDALVVHVLTDRLVTGAFVVADTKITLSRGLGVS